MSLIAIDMDGTLINSEHEINEANVQAIKKAQALGYEVVIATGRAHYDAQQILKEIGLSLYLIGANGSTIHSPSGTEILSMAMPEEQTREIVDWLNNENYYYELVCNDGIYTPRHGRLILQEEMNNLKKRMSEEDFTKITHGYKKQIDQTGYVFMDHYDEVFQQGQKANKILVFSFDEQKRKRGWETLEKNDEYTLVYSSPFNFELHHLDSSKGKALLYLSKILNMNMDRSMAIGDSGNDVAMFEVVTHSFAMTNADEEVRSKAKFIAETNDEDGVAKAIEQFLNV